MSLQMVKLNEANHRAHCGVTGLPFPSVTWRVKGQNIRNNPDISSVESKYEVDGTDLLIRSVHHLVAACLKISEIKRVYVKITQH